MKAETIAARAELMKMGSTTTPFYMEATSRIAKMTTKATMTIQNT